MIVGPVALCFLQIQHRRSILAIFSWKQSNIDTKIRKVQLRKNHRSTQQITEAAAHLLKRNDI